jgi:hypothetical protein
MVLTGHPFRQYVVLPCSNRSKSTVKSIICSKALYRRRVARLRRRFIPTTETRRQSASIKRALSSRLSGEPTPRRGSLPDPAARGRSIDRQVGYLNARDLCLIAPFSRYTPPLGAELLMNSATKARPISSCSMVPKGPGIRRPNQAA